MLTLDVGCGDHKLGLIGIDRHRTKDVDVVADAHHLPFQANLFDGVIISETLEHLASPQQALAEIFRVAKASVVFTIPNIKYWTRLVRWLLGREAQPFQDHIYAWDAPEFMALARSVGFHITKTGYIDTHQWKGKGKPIDRVLPRRFGKHSLIVTCRKP